MFGEFRYRNNLHSECITFTVLQRIHVWGIQMNCYLTNREVTVNSNFFHTISLSAEIGTSRVNVCFAHSNYILSPNGGKMLVISFSIIEYYISYLEIF